MAKILVVDDEKDIRTICNAVLKQAGYEVVTAIDGQDAIAKVDSAAKDNSLYDLVITDGNMPNIDGIALLKYMKETYPKIPVIVISANESYRNDARSLGADATFNKPFENKEVIKTIKNTLEAKFN